MHMVAGGERGGGQENNSKNITQGSAPRGLRGLRQVGTTWDQTGQPPWYGWFGGATCTGLMQGTRGGGMKRVIRRRKFPTDRATDRPAATAAPCTQDVMYVPRCNTTRDIAVQHF